MGNLQALSGMTPFPHWWPANQVSKLRVLGAFSKLPAGNEDKADW